MSAGPRKQVISPADHERITSAIRQMEQSTSGEIFAVVARESDDYFYVAGFMAALWALLIGLVLAFLSYFTETQISVLVLTMAQLASFAGSLLLFHFFPDLKYWFVPRAIAYKRASNNAVRQFLAHGIHTTDDRSGVLIFVSLAERYAEIVADAGINEKVDQSQWDNMMGVLITKAREGDIAEGFLHVIENAGELLCEHFPPIDGQKNELDDRLIEL